GIWKLTIKEADEERTAQILADAFVPNKTKEEEKTTHQLTHHFSCLDNVTFGLTVGAWIQLLRKGKGDSQCLMTPLKQVIKQRFEEQKVPSFVLSRYAKRWDIEDIFS